MNETRYTVAQMALITGTDPAYIASLRRQRMVEWQQSYTLEQVKAILNGIPLLEREKINPRAYKALELHDLYARLAKEAQT